MSDPNEPILEKVEAYLDEVERTLDLPEAKTREVVDEMRADLLAFVRAHQKKGASESEAVSLALNEMGEATTVAQEIQKVVPPFSRGWIKWARYGLCILTILMTLYLLWGIRAWTYGLGAVPLILVVFAPVVLILWPGIVWRKNWLYGIVPAGFAIFFSAMILTTGTAKTSVTMHRPLEPPSAEELQQRADQEASEEAMRKKILWGTFLGFTGVNIALFLAIQQRRQRRITIAGVILTMAGTEIPFQIDEYSFRQNCKKIEQAVLAFRTDEDKPIPSVEELKKFITENDLPRFNQDHARYFPNPESNHFSVHWKRPLERGFSLVYNSSTGKVHVND